MTEEKKKPNVVTCCKDCIFAIYKDITQVGCAFNRIDKYKSQGAVVKEAYDHQKEFFLIEERLCMACRDKEWIDKYENNSIDNLKNIARTQMTVFSDVFIHVNDINGLKKTVDSLLLQTLPPLCVHAIIRNKGIRPASVHRTMIDVPKWEFHIATSDELSEEASLDFFINTCKSKYFSVFKDGFEVPETYFADIDTAINDELEQFVLIKPDEQGNGFWTQLKLYQKLRGNEYWPQDETHGEIHTYIEKVLTLADKYKTYKLIKNFKDIKWTR